jgi:hypothetical protein
MKLLIALMLFITSCSSDVTISKEEYRKLKGISEYPKPFHTNDKDLEYWEWRIILGEDSHEYLTNDRGKRFAFIHYPECKKCIKSDSIRDIKIDSLINLLTK